jgi:hypothetical protein
MLAASLLKKHLLCCVEAQQLHNATQAFADHAAQVLEMMVASSTRFRAGNRHSRNVYLLLRVRTFATGVVAGC